MAVEAESEPSIPFMIIFSLYMSHCCSMQTVADSQLEMAKVKNDAMIRLRACANCFSLGT